MEISQFMAQLHPRLVPFPIVLLLTALVFDAVGLALRSERVHWAGKLLMLLGTVTLLLAFICGICAEIWAGRAGVPHQQIKWHELAATLAAWGFVGLTAWRIFLEAGQRRAMAAYVCCGVALYGLVALAGYRGGELVREYGAAVTGARADTVLSMHDLNTLAQRQTDLNLKYSDMMHCVAGWLVVVLCAALFVRILAPQHVRRVWWAEPTLLAAGGVALFIFADLDLYALTDPRQFYDREVQMHKLIALILTVVGVHLWRRKRKTAGLQQTEAQIHFQNRRIAVLALIGGGALFTHVHTVAPYANVAAGVYINHIVMGVVALAIGAVKLLDDALPGNAKWRALLFPSVMTVQAFLLVTYTEGIPWWAGIGHYNRWGPNGGTIAPFGRQRAELVFDPGTAQMDVRVLERFEDRPVRVPATNINVSVRRRYQDTGVSLDAVDAENGTASHFRGSASFLKDALYFDALVQLPMRGRLRTAYIDPWVTPAVQGIPPNERARFVCPMHEGIRSTAPEQCRLCDMPLVPILAKPATELHDPKYTMDLEHESDLLRFVPRHIATGEIVTDLLIVHEYLLHLIIVNEDLSLFDHVHPERQPDGSFTIDYHFPRPDNYLLFADITPTGERSQVFRLPLSTRPGPHIHVTYVTEMCQPGLAREVGPYHVQLILQPRRLVAQRHAHLAFRVSRDGKPVTDLAPYIGAMGHCVVISEDGRTYLHSHPEQLFAVSPADRGGPDVAFHTEFPRAGRYKVWGQFKHGEEIVVADFVVEVARPILPRWLVNFLIFD
jgi:uncharacterized membrane protein